MSRRKQQLTEVYDAVDEAGNTHRIHVFTEFIDASALSGPPQWIEGLKAHKMDNGSAVNVEPDGTLIDVQTGRKMRRR